MIVAWQRRKFHDRRKHYRARLRRLTLPLVQK